MRRRPSSPISGWSEAGVVLRAPTEVLEELVLELRLNPRVIVLKAVSVRAGPGHRIRISEDES